MSRYETPTRGPGIEDGLAARLADPLWLLGRQWQLGEFRHENVASPAWVEVEVAAHRVDEWRPADRDDWLPLDLTTTPLETLVEEHGDGTTPRLRLEGGLRWRRALATLGRDTDLAAFVGRCPFPDVPLAQDADRALRARIPDGAALASSLAGLADEARREGELAALRGHGEVGANAVDLARLATDWLAWWTARVVPPVPPEADAWDEHRLEHRLRLRSSTLPGVELRAEEYLGGHLDWTAFDAIGTDAGPDPAPIVVQQVALPTSARFGGMPAARLWEMEDARFDPGAVDAAPIDLGRLMLSAYATVYGNDWFVVPVRLPIATLSTVRRFAVRDVFGGTTELTAVGVDQDGWSLYGLTQGDVDLEPGAERSTSPWFLLSPTAIGTLESNPTDVLVLLRDEMANVAWAVEATVADDQGRTVDRLGLWAAREVEPETVTSPSYRVLTEVPDHWFPLLPEQFEDLESVRLRIAALARVAGGNPVPPMGSLLPPIGSWLHEEEVPRSGVKVVRVWQHARWNDGSRHVWQGRQKLTGRGEGDSGLRFDQVVLPDL